MLNVQTEHLENHTARLTVEVDAERLEQAMRKAAKKIAQKGRIPGFRPGKAPYNIVLNLYGREAVLSEALDDFGEAIYRETLDAAQIEPYAMGKLEDVQEEGRKLVFVVPKRPTIELGGYRDVRIDHETPEITDEMLNEMMENLRQNQALLEPADRPAKIGDQVTFEHISVSIVPGADEDEMEAVADLEAELEAAMAEEADADAVALEVDDLEEDGDEESEDEDDLDEEDEEEDDDYEDDDDYDEEDEEETILHEHDFNRVLRDDKDDFFPGFSKEIVGLSTGQEKEFFLDVPQSDDTDPRIAGKRLHVELHLGQVQARTVPEWSDDLAKRISENKFETILDLRVDTRKQMQEMAVSQANQNIAMQALDKIVEGATVQYPEELVQDYISDLLEDLENNVLRQQGFTLKDYMRLSGQTMDQLRERYRDSAIKRAQRSLVMAEVVRAEKIDISSADIDAEIDRIAGQVGGEQSGQFRQFLSTPQSRMNIGTEMVTTRVLERLAAIAKGENPPIPADEPAAESAPAAEPAAEAAPAAEVTDEAAASAAESAPEPSEPTEAQES